MMEEFLKIKRLKVGRWQKLLGLLCHLSQVVPAGRSHLNHLFGSLQGILSVDKNLRRRVSDFARTELDLWLAFLNANPGRPFRMVVKDHPADYVLMTDASQSFGYGAVIGNKWLCGAWPEECWHSLNIAFLELYPIFAAVSVWKHVFIGKTVRVKTDNIAIVSVINKMYAKEPLINQLVKKLAMLCMSSDIYLLGHHIRGDLNIKADMLSRGHITEFTTRFPSMDLRPTALPANIRPESLEGIVRNKK